MNEYSGSIRLGGRSKKKGLRLRPWVMLVFPIAAILFQVFVPLYVSLLSYLELPLLMTIYFSMTRRSQVARIFIGAGIGLAQDALSHEPIGLLGMVKTLMGYAAASLGVRLDTENVLVRFSLGFLGLICHQGLQWALRHILLGEAVSFEILATFLAAFANGAVAVPLFHLLDKLKENA
jgi:rod shape-determining protein MreD